MLTMSLLSESETQYLQAQKQVSGSHGCKARTIFPWAHEMDTTLFPDFGLTNRKMLSVSRCVPWGQTQRLQDMFSEKQAQRKRPL
jgi:hypothetical protein